MSTRTQRNAPLRFARTAAEAFKDESYACAIEGPQEGPGLMVSPAFWIGLLMSIGGWAFFLDGLAWLLENAK